MGIRPYPRSSRIRDINDGGGHKVWRKGAVARSKVFALRAAKYSLNRRFRCLSLGLLAAGAQRCADNGRNHLYTRCRVVGIDVDIRHGLVDRMVDTPTHPVPPTHLSPSLLYSSPLVLVLLVWAGWVDPVTSGARVSCLPASLCSSWWRGGCVSLWASWAL